MPPGARIAKCASSGPTNAPDSPGAVHAVAASALLSTSVNTLLPGSAPSPAADGSAGQEGWFANTCASLNIYTFIPHQH